MKIPGNKLRNATLSIAVEVRWQHMALCSVCTPRAWVLGLPLCPVGTEIREELVALLASLEPPGCPCGGTGTIVSHDGNGIEYHQPCPNTWCKGYAGGGDWVEIGPRSDGKAYTPPGRR